MKKTSLFLEDFKEKEQFVLILMILGLRDTCHAKQTSFINSVTQSVILLLSF